jgi:hypothetical protein
VGVVGLALMIGLRFEVGGDWMAYKRMFMAAEYGRLGTADPAYRFLNWAVQGINGDLWLVNLICAAVFVWGLYRFSVKQPEPWLAFVVAIPYLVIVVAMGYTRQAVSIGLLMAGLASLLAGASSLRMAAYIAGAALFHRTAVVMMPLVVFASKRTYLLSALAMIAATILMYDILLTETAGDLFKYYIEEEYASEGALVRVAMNVIPATLFLLRPSAFGFDLRFTRILRYLCYGALIIFALVLFFPQSTALDRLALYLAPLQIAVWSRVPLAYRAGRLARLLIVSYACAVQFVWLNYAAHSELWLPYRVYPIFGL